MCGRYLIDDEAYADILIILNNLNKEKKIYGSVDYSGVAGSDANEFSRGEIFPTYIAPVFEQSGAVAVKWGFPHWKNPSVIINARSETAAEKNMFRKALRERRCVVPSSGFFEWSRTGGNTGANGVYQNRGRKRSDKYLFTLPDEHMVYMAGIIGTFKDASGEMYDAFTILTTAANDSVAPIHDRMPVLLAKDEFNSWISDSTFTSYALNRTQQELSPMIA